MQLLERVMQARLNGPGRNAKPTRDLVDLQIAVVAQRHDHAVVGRQGCDGIAQYIAVIGLAEWVAGGDGDLV